mmetsp:Transcript_40803/g.77948  ORF Transcript_40803/g.77948 Transcript_40803/m.77948 type:complete len:440 (+) Transcript_40803:1600-2919(+)
MPLLAHAVEGGRVHTSEGEGARVGVGALGGGGQVDGHEQLLPQKVQVPHQLLELARRAKARVGCHEAGGQGAQEVRGGEVRGDGIQQHRVDSKIVQVVQALPQRGEGGGAACCDRAGRVRGESARVQAVHHELRPRDPRGAVPSPVESIARTGQHPYHAPGSGGELHDGGVGVGHRVGVEEAAAPGSAQGAVDSEAVVEALEVQRRGGQRHVPHRACLVPRRVQLQLQQHLPRLLQQQRHVGSVAGGQSKVRSSPLKAEAERLGRAWVVSQGAPHDGGRGCTRARDHLPVVQKLEGQPAWRHVIRQLHRRGVLYPVRHGGRPHQARHREGVVGPAVGRHVVRRRELLHHLPVEAQAQLELGGAREGGGDEAEANEEASRLVLDVHHQVAAVVQAEVEASSGKLVLLLPLPDRCVRAHLRCTTVNSTGPGAHPRAFAACI